MAPGKTNRRARASQASAWELKRPGAGQGNPRDLSDTSALNEGEKKHRLCCAWDLAFLHIPQQIAGLYVKMKQYSLPAVALSTFESPLRFALFIRFSLASVPQTMGLLSLLLLLPSVGVECPWMGEGLSLRRGGDLSSVRPRLSTLLCLC